MRGISQFGEMDKKKRHFFCQGELPEDQKRILGESGLLDGLTTHLWQRHYEELKAFYMEHGHCNMPADYEENPKLAKWVEWQHCRHIFYAVSAEQKELFGQIGFKLNNIVDDSSGAARVSLPDNKGKNGNPMKEMHCVPHYQHYK